MTRNLQIIGSRRSGGAETAFVRITAGLAAAGAETRVAVPARSTLNAMLPADLPRHAIAMRGNWDIFSRRAIHRLVEQQNIRIVQTWMGRATRLTQLPNDGAAVHIARLGGYYKPDGFRHAHAWVVNAEGLRQHLLQHGFPAARLFRIPNFVAIPTGVDAAGLAVPDDAWVLFAAGRLHPIKGMDTLLEAFASLPAEIGGRPVHLVIAGEGKQREELEDYVRQQQLAGRVHFLGWRQDLPELYKRADAVVFPSREMEGFGNVILEAWAARKPLLATASRGATELILPEQDALLSRCEAASELAANIQRLLTDDSLRNGLIDAGTERVQQEFTRDAVIQQYLDLYAALLRER